MSVFALLVMGCGDEPVIAKLLAHLTPKQIKVAGEFFVDGYTHDEIGRRHAISERTVRRMIEVVESTCLKLKIPLPHKLKSHTSRHVRQLDMDKLPELA